MSRKILFETPNVTGFFQDISDNSYEQSDFSHSGRNLDRSGQPSASQKQAEVGEEDV